MTAERPGANSKHETPRRIAVIGAGIAGLASAYLLSRKHQVSLFESNAYLGGHTNTVEVTLEGHTHPVDTGFLVFNDRTYPNLIALFKELGVESHSSDMSFGVSLDAGRLEWAGTNLDAVFAQRRNLISPSFISMLRDIMRFNKQADHYLAQTRGRDTTLGELLTAERYGKHFCGNYLLPMAAAIWSSATDDILAFPAATFLQFCQNHGLLQINDRPQWRTVAGGGREYVARIAARLGDIRVNAQVFGIRRLQDHVVVQSVAGSETFDDVVLATHAPTSIALLEDADANERAILSSVRYQDNVVFLHTDETLLPRRSKVWSAWNYLGGELIDGKRPVCVSYLINRLQPLPFKAPVVVTLNPISEPAASKTLARFNYEHPLLDTAAVQAQGKLHEIQGARRTWFAGAWTGYGFHEDGLKSALRVARDFGVLPDWAKI
jgi:predicted NAD/FAD-binding protein